MFPKDRNKRYYKCNKFGHISYFGRNYFRGLYRNHNMKMDTVFKQNKGSTMVWRKIQQQKKESKMMWKIKLNQDKKEK